MCSCHNNKAELQTLRAKAGDHDAASHNPEDVEPALLNESSFKGRSCAYC